MKKNTAAEGASRIIRQVIAKVKRTIKAQQESGIDSPHLIDGYDLIDWLRDWDKRAQAKAGGLGRKKKSSAK